MPESSGFQILHGGNDRSRKEEKPKPLKIKLEDNADDVIDLINDDVHEVQKLLKRRQRQERVEYLF